MADQLANAAANVGALMNDILTNFKPGAKITVLVRRPGDDEGDFMLTNDAIPEARKMLDRCEKRGEVK